MMKKLLITLALLPALAFAWQPTKPVEAIVGFTPGSANEVLFRAAAAEVTKNTGVNFVVINKGGAGGVIASEQFYKTTADGHSVLVMSFTGTYAMDKIAVPFGNGRSYTVDSFVYPAYLASNPFSIIANVNDPVSTPKQLVESLKNEKSTFSASGGARLVFETIQTRTNFPLGEQGVVRVEHKGPKDALMDVMGGHVRYAVIPLSVSVEMYKAGKVKIVALSAKSTQLPELHPMSEVLTGFDVAAHWGLGLQKDTSSEIVEWYNKEFTKALKSDSVKELYKQQLFSLDPALEKPDAIARWMKQTDTKYQPLIDVILKGMK
jgi:tripartite-type tricarboxylate transporter receptor subunit TctC